MLTCPKEINPFVLILTYFINLNAFLASRQQWRSFCVLTGTSNLYSHKEWQRKIRDQFSKVVPNRLQIWRSPWQIDQRKMFEMGHNLQDHSLFLEFSLIMVVHYGRIGHLYLAVKLQSCLWLREKQTHNHSGQLISKDIIHQIKLN